MTKFLKNPLVFAALCTVFAACVFIDFLLMYKAGCAGDLKGGTTGDFQEALNYESIGFLFLVVGALAASIAASMIGTFHAVFRVAQGLTTFAAIWVLMLLLNMQIEIWGNGACLL